MQNTYLLLWWEDESDFDFEEPDVKDDDVDFDLLLDEGVPELLLEVEDLWCDDSSALGELFKLPPPLIKLFINFGSLCEMVIIFRHVCELVFFSVLLFLALRSSKFGIKKRS